MGVLQHLIFASWNVLLFCCTATNVAAWTWTAVGSNHVIPKFSRRRTSNYGLPHRCSNSNIGIKLFSISEWRDTNFDLPDIDADKRKEYGDGLPKEICVLPFPYQEVLLQGETKQLRLYEQRFIQLFDTCIQHHCNVAAMGMIAQSGIIQTVPLVEIEDYNRIVLNDELSIFVTIRVVGRAKLIDVIQSVPYIKAVCIELIDTVPPSLELPCLLASHIEESIVQLSSMEHRFETAKRSGEVLSSTTGSSSNKNSTAVIDPNDLDLVMQHRIRIAKLEDTYYDDSYDEDDDNVTDDESIEFIDRRKRFRRAYNIALATDTQGYQVAAIPADSSIDTQADKSDNTTSGSGGTVDRTVQELAAISWAAFCTEILPEIDAAVRIQALDCDNVFTRLRLASGLMRQKKILLRTRMEKSGMSVSVDTEESSSSSNNEGDDIDGPTTSK